MNYQQDIIERVKENNLYNKVEMPQLAPSALSL